MTAFKKIFVKYGIFIVPAFAFVLIFLLPAFGRLDLTADQRYTLTEASKKILNQIQKPIQVEVFLKGDFPAEYQELSNETKYLLDQFQQKNPNITYTFIDPISAEISEDTLASWGVFPSILPEYQEGKVSETLVYPYAVFTSGKRKVAVPLLQEINQVTPAEQINKSVEALEYQLISGVQDVQNAEKKKIGIIINQEELNPNEFAEFMRMASRRYKPMPIVPAEDSVLSLKDAKVLDQMEAIVLAKPRKAFKDSEKLVLDQYIMKGGKSLWMIDAVNAEMDSLTRSQKITAFPMDVNLSDLFFSYGIRIKSGLIKDLKQHALIKIVASEVAGNPQFMSVPWPYFPLGVGREGEPLTKNINPVKFEFAASIDTLSRKGIKHKVLFETSNKTIQKALPAFVELNEIASVDSLAMREKPTTPKILALAAEGIFPSAYQLRQERNSYPGFLPKSAPNKMVVIADGDVGRNKIFKGQPTPIGTDILTDEKFGNEQFLQNVLDWLMDDTNILSIRNRTVESRLLDIDVLNTQKQWYQGLNILLPTLLFLILGGLFWYRRKKKYNTK